MIGIKVDFVGRFDALKASRELDHMYAEMLTDVAAHASAEVHAILNAKIKHPTPYYETQITTERQANDLVIHDRGVIYGPWLEGVGSRNFPVTRFKGYHAFRDAEAKVRGQLDQILERIMRKYLERLP